MHINRILVRLATSLMIATAVGGCSTDDGSSENDNDSRVTERVAQEAVRTIQEPIEKAESAKELGDQRAALLQEYNED